MVTGLPSSGMEYEVLSVRRDMSVARSVPVMLPLVSTMDSVGAGKIGLRVSTPMMKEKKRAENPFFFSQTRPYSVLGRVGTIFFLFLVLSSLSSLFFFFAYFGKLAKFQGQEVCAGEGGKRRVVGRIKAGDWVRLLTD